MPPQLNTDIAEFVLQVIKTCPDIQSVRLFGSRANGTAHETSDWDLMAFGSDKSLSCLKQHRELHRSDVDFLLVTNGGDYTNAWGESEKSDSLELWEWKHISDLEAEYTETKPAPGANWGNVALSRRRAIRLWPR